MIKFEYIANLHFIWLALGLVLILGIYISWQKKAITIFAEKQLFQKLSPRYSTFTYYVHFLLIILAVITLSIGLANPQIGTKLETVKREGVDVMIAVDVSKSMDAKDIAPSRMLKARQFVSNLINAMANDRIGLIVFAGNAYLQMPLTVDYAAAKMYLKLIDTKLIPSQGTAIGEAVSIAQKAYPKASKNQKVLLIISDGENHEGDAEDAIAEAKENNIKVITIGVGTAKGAPIPIDAQGILKKDNEGNTIITKLNEAMLQALASDANGKYYNISDPDAVDEIVKQLGSLDGKVFEEKVITDYKDYFQVFLLIALFLMLLEMILSFKKSKIQWNLFKN
jgi:Ca-activated chloride channel family protein